MYSQYTDELKAAGLQVLFSLVRADADASGAARLAVRGGDIPWPYIRHMAVRHKMASILYFKVKKLGILHQLPDNVQRFFKMHYLQVTGGNMRLRKRLTDILALLESEDVPVVPFKGPVRTQALYDDSAVRYCQDLDLLVPRQKAAAARKVLGAAGYAHRDEPLEALNCSQFEKFAAYEKEFELGDSAGATLIDLHWRLAGGTWRPFDYTFCRDRLQRMWFDGREVLCLSDEDMVVYLCVHGSLEGWQNLGAVLCLAEYMEKRPGLDWDLVLELAGVLHCRRMLLLGLFLAKDLFGAAVPDKIMARMERDKAVYRLADRIYRRLLGTGAGKSVGSHIERRFADIPYQMAVYPNVLDKFYYLWRVLFWPTQKDWRDFPVPARFSFLLFLRRPVVMGVELVGAVGGRR